MSIKKILFTTKLRELSFEALRCITQFKKAGLEEIILLHVIPIEEVGFVPYGGYDKEEYEKLRNKALKIFDKWSELLKSRGIRAKSIVEVGKSVPKILDVAEKENVDLVVAGRSKIYIVERFIGNDTEELLQYSKWPVLLMKYSKIFADEESVRLCQKFMFATDFTKKSENAKRFVLELKGMVDTLYLVHVVESNESEQIPERQKLLDQLEEFYKNSGFEKVETVLLTGPVVDKLIELSKEMDTVIMGTSGKGKWQRIWVGSVSRNVAENADLPVILVPSK